MIDILIKYCNVRHKIYAEEVPKYRYYAPIVCTSCLRAAVSTLEYCEADAAKACMGFMPTASKIRHVAL